MQTCWFLADLYIPGVASNSSIQRRVQFALRPNISEPPEENGLFHVWVRKDSSNTPYTGSSGFAELALDYLRLPRWLIDTGGGATLASRVVESVDKCNAEGSCYYTYESSFDAGSYQYVVWVGVVGRTTNALYTPFDLSFRIVQS
mmetsp:Transcript_44198/g.117876  ORF Transcript_44198/g.117876 Transcript_44198/m.117876 type:complete len:145 (+) Transcript_44198:466-900(+)